MVYTKIDQPLPEVQWSPTCRPAPRKQPRLSVQASFTSLFSRLQAFFNSPSLHKTYSVGRTEELLTAGSKSLKKKHVVKLRDVLKDVYEYNGVTCVAAIIGNPMASMLVPAAATAHMPATWACYLLLSSPRQP